MNVMCAGLVCVLKVWVCAVVAVGDESLPVVRLSGDWQLEVSISAGNVLDGQQQRTATLQIAPPTVCNVETEKHDCLPLFNSQTAGWIKGAPLRGVIAQECTSYGMLDPDSVTLRTGPEPDAAQLQLGQDFQADFDWGTIGRLPDGRLGENQPVYVSYRHGVLRIDSIVLKQTGEMELRQGEPHVATPVPPTVHYGERRLVNVFIPGRIAKLEPQHLFPILETAYQEPSPASPSVAEQMLPMTLDKLRSGRPLRILAWGDSVTDGTYLPNFEQNRWQAQFVSRLRSRFPQAQIELITEAWGGRSTASYLEVPAGGPHNYQETVLNARPDLIVSEFVNDAGLTPEQVEERYGKFLSDFTSMEAEWIILTPHYVRPDWMGLTAQRDIDSDPRPYVAGLRQFADRHRVALADASLRWGRLWRQGIPYNTLHMNTINHPNREGMRLFADSLMALFP